MNKRVDLYNSTYSNFERDVPALIRKETFGNDIGQNSWITADEFDRFIKMLDVKEKDHVLEVACGSGGPASYLAKTAGCRVTGIDINDSAIETAIKNAKKHDQTNRLGFIKTDVNSTLPFEDNSFDAVLCIDAMNHFPERLKVLKEWFRVLKPGSKALFTDPVVITGPVTNKEIELRSSIDFFIFVPQGVNENLISEAGFKLIRKEDVSGNASLVSKRWYNSREKYKEDLFRIEGEERFEGLQKFFNAVYKLTSDKRLSRIVYLIEKSHRS